MSGGAAAAPARGGIRLRNLAFAAALALAGCSAQVEPGSLEGWNVLLITVDTLRADHVGFAGYAAAETPAMDGLAERGTVFDHAVAAAPVTLPSHATILTGRYPPGHGARSNGLFRLSEEAPTLAELLRARGYETAGFIAAFVLDGRYGTDRGFDHFDDDLQDERRRGHSTPERGAGKVTDAVLEWLAARDAARPFFVWAHYYDPHALYEPPSDLALRFAANPYDGEIAYADREIGRLLGALRRGGSLERTLVVLVGDHGEALGDGGELQHGLLLRGSTLRVPLVVSAPGVLPEGRRIAGTVSTADILPTVLALVGAERPPVDGVSLLGALAGGDPPPERVAYSETRLAHDEYGWAALAGVRTDRWAWVRAPRPELYDLAADPGETRNVRDEHPDVAAELDRRTEAVRSRAVASDPEAPDEEEREALRALGYVLAADVPEATGADPKDMLASLRDVDALGMLVDEGRFEDAVKTGRQLLAKQPDNRTIHLYLAQALDYLGRADEAIAEARAAFEESGSMDEDGTLLALFLAKAGKLEESEELLRAFTRNQSEWSQHWFNLGNLLSQQDRVNEAVEAYEHALALDPASVPTLTNFAEALSRVPEPPDRGRPVRMIEEAIRLLPGDDRPVLAKERILQNLGSPEPKRKAKQE